MNLLENTKEYFQQSDNTTNSTAQNIVKNFSIYLPTDIVEKIYNNFYIYARKTKTEDTKLSNNALLPVIKDIIDFLMKGSFKDIETKRQYWKDTLSFLDGENYRIIEKELNSNVGNRKNLIQNITDIIHKHEALGYIPLYQFFEVPVIEEKDFTPSDIYYYKGIGLNILLMRQLVCEGYECFDEYLDYITPEYDLAHDSYAHGSRRYYKPFQDGYVLCINKEKLHNHLTSLKHTKKQKDDMFYQINTDHKNELYLYHSIVPISCVDKIIKVKSKQ